MKLDVDKLCYTVHTDTPANFVQFYQILVRRRLSYSLTADNFTILHVFQLLHQVNAKEFNWYELTTSKYFFNVTKNNIPVPFVPVLGN